MNQILYEDTDTPKTDIKKIILFFAITLIVFGIILAGIGIWNVVSTSNNTKKENTLMNNGTKPTVETSVFEEDQILINITHDKAIDRILYNWNNGADTIIQGYNRQNIEELITMPLGENVLSLRVIDVAGQETMYTQTYVLNESGIDIIKPTIDIAISNEDGTIIVTAKDETEISYITYRWNDEEEAKIDRSDDNLTQIEVSIPILRGQNDLTIIAVDANNNTETKIQKFEGITAPTITVTQYADELTIVVKDEQGLEKVECILNGKGSRWVKTTEDMTEWVYKLKIPEGDSTIIVNAWNTKEVKAKEFRGKCNYTP